MKMPEKYKLQDDKRVSTLVDKNVILHNHDNVRKQACKFSDVPLNGWKLLHTAIKMKSDIAQAVSVVSQLCSNPTEL